MSKNLNQKLCSLTLVEDWYETPKDSRNWLASLFIDSLGSNIFSSIYISIRKNPENASQEATETYEYFNIGWSTSEMAEYFNTKYSLNYFAYNFNVVDDYQKLKIRIQSIYYANMYKYKKMIELLGYKYNPLYNVDANELYSNMESIGDTKSEREPTGTATTTTGTLHDGSIGDSTTTNYVNPYDQNTGSSADYVDSKTEQTAITTSQSFEEYKETVNNYNEPANHYIYDSQTGEYVKAGIFSVAAADSAFGVALGGAERYYAEKRIRQGNIGITKATELIESQREAVKFNILDEFFRDIEKEVIVGIY